MTNTMTTATNVVSAPIPADFRIQDLPTMTTEHASASVMLEDSGVPPTIALESGAFFFTDVPPGTFAVTSGDARHRVTVRCGEVTELALRD